MLCCGVFVPLRPVPLYMYNPTYHQRLTLCCVPLSYNTLHTASDISWVNSLTCNAPTPKNRQTVKGYLRGCSLESMQGWYLEYVLSGKLSAHMTEILWKRAFKMNGTNNTLHYKCSSDISTKDNSMYGVDNYTTVCLPCPVLMYRSIL